MRRIVLVIALLSLLAVSAAQASHERVFCGGERQETVTSQGTCITTIRCPLGPQACRLTAHAAGEGLGYLGVTMYVSGIPVADCGPKAPQGCFATGLINLPPGATALMGCLTKGAGVLVHFSCVATPSGHV